jgi:hypothetical protein
MKSPLSFGLIIAVSGALACSSDEGKTRDDRGNGGSGNASGSTGGTSGGTAGTSGGGSAGTGAGGTGGGGSTGANYGPALVITGDGLDNTVKDVSGTTGINGAASISKSTLGTTATAHNRDGALCMNGATALIGNLPNGTPDYTGYYGALIGLDLNRLANAAAGDAGAADAGDAGGDAGPAPLGQVPGPWTPGTVKGFSFVVTTEPGTPALPPLRFQTAPTNSVPADDHFCKSLTTVTSGVPVDVLFSEIVRNCYDAVPGPAVFADPAGYTQLQNIQWQVSAEVTIAYMFDFCVSDIKPIY